MDHRNLDKAMEIFACLITGETVGRENHRDLYEAYSSQAEVYDMPHGGFPGGKAGFAGAD